MIAAGSPERVEALTRLAAAICADPELTARAERRMRGSEKLRLAAECAVACARVRRRLGRRSIEELLADLRGEVLDAGRPAWEVPGEHVRAIRVARAVQRTLRRLPGDTRCLTRALVLIALLSRRAIGSTLVIAVAPGDELTAHAWVEHGGVALLPEDVSQLGRLVSL